MSIEKSSFQSADDDVIVFDSNAWYWCHCTSCGWQGSSEDTDGGGQIADTGDYGDVLCPNCSSNDLEGDNSRLLPSFNGVLRVPKTLMQKLYDLQKKEKELTAIIVKIKRESSSHKEIWESLAAIMRHCNRFLKNKPLKEWDAFIKQK